MIYALQSSQIPSRRLRLRANATACEKIVVDWPRLSTIDTVLLPPISTVLQRLTLFMLNLRTRLPSICLVSSHKYILSAASRSRLLSKATFCLQAYSQVLSDDINILGPRCFLRCPFFLPVSRGA